MSRFFPKIIFLLLAAVFSTKCFGNINAINFKEIQYPSTLQPNVDFLISNEGIYNHWVHDWVATVSKEEVVKTLGALYDGLDKIQDKNLETLLLLGDIAHYLYNLELEPYYQRSVDNYQKAVQLAPGDYRVYWFLANHYGLSNQPGLSMKTYHMALSKLPPSTVNEFFWWDYAVSCVPAGMFSTALYAMDQYLKTGHPADATGAFIRQVKKSIKKPPLDTTIEVKDLWASAGRQDNKVLFASRVLGTRIAIDSNWHVDLRGWENKVSAVVLSPLEITSKVNKESIGYSILTLVKVPQPGQSLNDFMNLFIKNKDNIKPITLTTKFGKCIAYEIKDPSIYPNWGGAHMYQVAIERNEPDYPGMVLETPDETMSKGSKGLSYYTISSRFNRLKGKLYYLVMLDSCEYINQESLAVFKDYLENGLVIE